MPIYLKLTECTETVRKRLNALNRMDPELPMEVSGIGSQMLGDETLKKMTIGPGGHEGRDGGDEGDSAAIYVAKLMDYANQRSILLGHDTEKIRHHDFFEHLTQEQIDQLLQSCTPKQREHLQDIARKVLVWHPVNPGCSWYRQDQYCAALAENYPNQSKTVLMCSSSNAAVNNICRRADAENATGAFLNGRRHPEDEEIAAVIRYDPIRAPRHPSSLKQSKRASNSIPGPVSLGESFKSPVHIQPILSSSSAFVRDINCSARFSESFGHNTRVMRRVCWVY